MRLKHRRKLVALAICLLTIYLIYLNLASNQLHHISNQRLAIRYESIGNHAKIKFLFTLEAANSTSSNTKVKVLVISNAIGTISKQLSEVISLLESNRIYYRQIAVAKNSNGQERLVRLNTIKKIYFNMIIFESFDLVENLNILNQKDLLNFCRIFNISLISFTLKETRSQFDAKGNECKIVCKECSSKFKLTKLLDEQVISFKGDISTAFHQLSQYESLLSCSNLNVDLILRRNEVNLIVISTKILDMFPNALSMILDMLSYWSFGRLELDLNRYVQIDIDDIFVGTTTKRMIPADVTELIKFQHDYLSKSIFKDEEFKFNLGYSGNYFKSGNEEENKADELLIKSKDSFNWFEHGWSHLQPHLLNSSNLKEQMYFNYNFALEKNLPIDSFYAVSPKHSGIYPVYDELYKSWTDLWLIKATSTEEYPHLYLKNYWMRRGFVHNGIMVVPRQTCGIYTHTIHFNSYPGGIDKLIEKIKGGDLFKSIIHNRVLIYMTHMTNYGNDRLALFLFKSLFEFATKWTHIKFRSLSPLKLAEKYFQIYTKDYEPIWTNPCDDKRHMQIWSLNSSTYCDRFPRLIIVGPQKTGTTALYSFMNEHPHLKSNKFTSQDFEETQFFSNKNYFNGVDWYVQLFETKTTPKSEPLIYFEKSANYFSEPKAPMRIKKLLKDVKLVVITINPIDRAYSWYQHMRSHNDTTALTYTFYDIITFNSTNNQVKKLKDRCLDPGNYYKHLMNWLDHFSAKQIYLIDGDALKRSPSQVMYQLQNFIFASNMNQTNYFVNFRKILTYNKKKRFFCIKDKTKVVNQTITRCLGASKGRIYNKMDQQSRFYLRQYYANSNKLLYKMLVKYKFTMPAWLQREINSYSKI